ncbi:MAG: hypothetical protein IIT38_01545 [Bacteroidales bacterium]|nr:hypothetical protein [Bacteroidales bacterium]
MIRLLPKGRKNKSASLLLVLPNLSLELCSLATEGTQEFGSIKEREFVTPIVA